MEGNSGTSDFAIERTSSLEYLREGQTAYVHDNIRANYTHRRTVWKEGEEDKDEHKKSSAVNEEEESRENECKKEVGRVILCAGRIQQRVTFFFLSHQCTLPQKYIKHYRAVRYRIHKIAEQDHADVQCYET